MLPEHLDRHFTVSRPAVHPDGWAVVAAKRPDFAADAYVGQLWRVPITSSCAEGAGRRESQDPPRRLTRGFRDDAPQVSPDGALIGFLRAEQGKPPQLAIMPAGGGEPLVVTDRKMGVSAFTFTPDSKRAVFISAVPEEGRYGTVEGVDPGSEDPRHITDLQLQMNGRGYVADQRQHVFVLDLPDVYGEPPVKPVGRVAKALAEAKTPASLLPQATQLTEGNFDHGSPVAFNDAVIVVSARHESRDRDLRSDLCRIALDGTSITQLTGPEVGGDSLSVSSPVIVGNDLYFLAGDMGPSGGDFVGTNAAVYRLVCNCGDSCDPTAPRAGFELPTRLTDPENLEFHDLVSDGAGVVLGLVVERGVGRPVRVEGDGTVAYLDVPETASVSALAANGDVIVGAAVTMTSPGELVRVETPEVLTDFAASLREAASPFETRELISTSPDGQEIQGWVVLPEGEGPHPVILNIHGGPYSQYSPGFFDESQVLARAGYAVVYCNPRGSASYGQAFGRSIKGDFGKLDRVDVMAFLDHALATVPGLDAKRVGVQGGSYGGYLTAWLIAHEHRFSGAIVERGFLDPRSFVGSADIGWFFTHAYNTDDPATMDAQSPLLLVDQVKTPTLVMHSEQDLRCPLGPALRYYTELKLAGVETEMLIFPGENHELSRSGRPWHRRQRFEATLAWWAKHL